jgi:hypothetical protein
MLYRRSIERVLWPETFIAVVSSTLRGVLSRASRFDAALTSV